MAFRQPQEQEQGVPSLGYRLSSNRQPGIEQSNNRMPDYQRIGDLPGARFDPYEERSFPNPDQIRRGKPAPMPMPDPRERYMQNPNQMGRQSTDPRERYIANTQGGHPNMSQFGYPMPNSGMFSGPIEMGSSMMEALPMAYMPGDYDDDDYGSFIPDSVIQMDRLDGMYGPEDEQNFDTSKGYENRIFGIDPMYYYRGGIASLKR